VRGIPKGPRKLQFALEKSGLTRFGGLGLFLAFCRVFAIRGFLGVSQGLTKRCCQSAVAQNLLAAARKWALHLSMMWCRREAYTTLLLLGPTELSAAW
jgi:hypothetical protein